MQNDMWFTQRDAKSLYNLWGGAKPRADLLIYFLALGLKLELVPGLVLELFPYSRSAPPRKLYQHQPSSDYCSVP